MNWSYLETTTVLPRKFANPGVPNTTITTISTGHCADERSQKPNASDVFFAMQGLQWRTICELWLPLPQTAVRSWLSWQLLCAPCPARMIPPRSFIIQTASMSCSGSLWLRQNAQINFNVCRIRSAQAIWVRSHIHLAAISATSGKGLAQKI